MTTNGINISALDNKQAALLNQLLSSLNSEQKLWLGGYLSGLNESTNTLLKLLNSEPTRLGSTSTPVKSSAGELLIMFGTRSGNSKKLADKTSKHAANLNLNTRLVDLNDYDPKKLKKEKNIVLIVSTDGEGEPPVAVEEFYNYLFSKKAPALKDLNYSVLALGDKTYKHFCKIGKDIDERLNELGANRFSERVDCDLDFEEDASKWITESILKHQESLGDTAIPAQGLSIPELPTETGTKESPYKAEVVNKILLNGSGSTKKTWHIELSIEDSGIQYKPGDSLGILCHNNLLFVEEIIIKLGLDKNETVTTYKGEVSLQEAIQKYYEISRLVPSMVIELAKLINNEKLTTLANDAVFLDEYCFGRDVLDLFLDYAINPTAQELIGYLRKLQARLYSISSSHSYNEDEVHLTVSQVEYETNKRKRKGVCSNFLAEIKEEDFAEIYIDENISFRLPEDPNTPVIMIGAGTGVAPYRAFLQERSLSDVKAKNWLFFGERNFTTDFIYQTEWQRYAKNGLLSNIDLAFSRDQKDKIYVQHKLLENSKEVYKWIGEGAHIYVCGDKLTMAKDVKSALLEIFRNEGGYSAGGAEDFYRKLRREKQLQEDVY